MQQQAWKQQLQENVISNVTWRGSPQKMKPFAVHPAAAAVLRRSFTNSASTPRKGSSSPERASVIIGPGPLRLCLCFASLIIGFIFSRETLLVLVIRQQQQQHHQSPLIKVPSRTVAASLSEASDVGIKFPYVPSSTLAGTDPVWGLPSDTKSRRVHVGRHEILVRPWPHPDTVELYRAHALLERVQKEQRSLYGPRNWKTVIAITPTFARTFQAIHLLGIMHTLKAVPGSVVWIVVEAGGRSNDTSAILASSQLDFVHLGINDPMPVAWELRRRMESRLRVEGLRHVRRQKLDGLVLFMDDSNVHSLQLFDEVQKVNWIGALSVGLLETSSASSSEGEGREKTEVKMKPPLPVQGPACNETCNVVGWHALRASPVDGEDQSLTDVSGGITDVATHLEWSGFVLNSRAVWEEESFKPEWMNEWEDWIVEEEDSRSRRFGSPLRLVKDQGFIEALGNCGREVMLWWVRVEARADSRYPSRWMLESPLEVTVAAKRTAWAEYVEQNETRKMSVRGGGGGRKLDPSEKQRSNKGQRSSAGRRGKRRQDQQQLQQIS